MKITKIKIDSFGALRDREFTLDRGVNLIEGSNEAGKTSLAMFIKFMLYGLSGRQSDAFPMSERKRFVNWDTGRAAGSLEFESGGEMFRVERMCDGSGREEKAVIALSTGTKVKCPGEVGEMFLGAAENVFVNTVFVRQLGTNSIDNAQIRSAIENILSSADEKVSVNKVIDKLDKIRVQLRHKTGNGGEIPLLTDKIASLELALGTAERQNSTIIETEAKLNDTVELIAKRESEIAELERLLQICDDVTALREREALRAALERHRRAGDEMDKLSKSFPGEKIRKEIAEVRAGLDSGRKDLSDAEGKLDELRGNAEPGELTEADCIEAGNFARELTRRSTSKKKPGIVTVLVAAIAAVCGLAVILSRIPSSIVIASSLFIASGVFAILAVLFFTSASAAKKQLRAHLDSWDAESMEELDSILTSKKDRIYDALLAKAQIESAQADVARAFDRLAQLDKRAREILPLFPSPLNADTDHMDCDKVLDLCQEETDRISSALSAQRDNLAAMGGECRTMAKRLEKYDFDAISLRELELSDSPEWKEAEDLTPQEVERLALRLKMARGQLQSHYQTREICKTSLAEVRATAKSPTEIAQVLYADRTELEEKKLRFDAIRLAIDTLREAGENLRSNMMPRIVEKASAMFSASTLGKYSTLGVSPDFTMDVSGDLMTRSADYLSAGSADAAYICLRIALASTIFGSDTPPLIFDESFAKIDEERLERMFSLLAASDNQTIVFTCRKSEKELIQAKNIISL